MIKAIIFDLDGLLFDSEPVHAKATSALLKSYGVDYHKTLDELFGRRVLDGMKILKKKFKIKDTVDCIFEKREKIFLSLVKNIKLMPGFCQLKSIIDKNSFKKGLATSGHRAYVDILIKKYKLHRYFDVVVTGDMVRYGKPSPEIFLKTAQRLKIKPKDCLVIEDSPLGLLSAKRAGMKCIIVPNQDTKKMKFIKADAVVKSLAKINLSLIKQIINV